MVSVDEIQHVKSVISLAAASVAKGNYPNVGVLVTGDGRQFVQESGTVESGVTKSAESAFQRALSSDNGISKGGTVLYSYGNPRLNSDELFLVSKVVYIVNDEEFHKRDIPLQDGEFDGLVEAFQFPAHPAFNALSALKLWDELYS